MQASEIKFGVEIETMMPDRVLAVGDYHRGVQVPWLPQGWKSERDGSIRVRPGYVACEFVSPILVGAAGLQEVIEAVKAIKARGAKVNASCGLHVTISWETNGVHTQKLITLYSNFEKGIYASTGTKSRERNGYTDGVQRHANAANAQRIVSSMRYHVLNLSNNGRAECRAFAGTLNTTKIAGYVQMVLGLAERAIKAKRVTNWVAPAVSETSPIKRGGEGLTCLNRLFYQLGWTKGRTDHTYGWLLPADQLPKVKAELVKLAQKYDRAR